MSHNFAIYSCCYIHHCHHIITYLILSEHSTSFGLAESTGNDVDMWPKTATNQRWRCSSSSIGHLLICPWRRLAAAFSRRRLTTSAMCLVELVLSRRLASHLRSWATLSWHWADSAAASAPSTYGCSRCSSYHALRIDTARAGSGLERPPQLHEQHTRSISLLIIHT